MQIGTVTAFLPERVGLGGGTSAGAAPRSLHGPRRLPGLAPCTPPPALRFLLAIDPDALTLVLGVVYRSISRYLIGKAGLARVSGETGA